LEKKKEGELFFYVFYGRFLSINRASTIATTMIRTNNPAIAGTKYVSAADAEVGVGATCVEAVFCTVAVCFSDRSQYCSNQRNVAMIVYLPGNWSAMNNQKYHFYQL